MAIALLNSIRAHDADTPIVMIPYDNHYQAVAKLLTKAYGVQIYRDSQLIERLLKRVHQIFGDRFFVRPNQFRKQICWFGPFDEFLYIDTDIVVFEKIINTFEYLSDFDFVHCDYQHKDGIKYVFTPKVLEEKVFSEDELKDVFNAGFWGSKKGLISEGDLYQTLGECAVYSEYFDFSRKVSDMPIINYIVLKRIPRRFNIVRGSKKGPGSWAGSRHFKYQSNRLIDPNVNQPLKYLHWAGIQIKPGCPYWDIWEYYRYINKPNSS